MVNEKRNTIVFFKDIYESYKNHENTESKQYIDDVYIFYDKNKSRFLRNIELCYKLYNNNKIHRYLNNRIK